MIEKPGIQKLKEWLDSEIDRLSHEGRSIANSKYVRESSYLRKYAYQDVRFEVEKIMDKSESGVL